MTIDRRAILKMNNTGRIHFYAQEHSLLMTSFLETKDEIINNDFFTVEENKQYEILFREIFMCLSNQEFPLQQVQQLILDMKSRLLVSKVLFSNYLLIDKFIEALPFFSPEQQSYIYKIFKCLMYNFAEVTEYLIEKNILIYICNVLIDENINDKHKILPIKCIHYIANRGKENVKKLFDKVSISYKGKNYRESPVNCMINLLSYQCPQKDEIYKAIQECNGTKFEGDPSTMKLWLLILKFFNAILSYNDFPTAVGKDIVDHIIQCTFAYLGSIDFLDCAIYGCSLAAENKYTALNFFNSMYEKAGITNFINILDGQKNVSISTNILLCFKSMIDQKYLEPKKLLQCNIIKHLAPHIHNDNIEIVCENAIQVLTSLIKADKNEFFAAVVQTDIPNILFKHLMESKYCIKVASVVCWNELISNSSIGVVQNLITNFPPILEATCSLILSDVNDDLFQVIFDMAQSIVQAYNVGGRAKEMREIINSCDIPSMIDSFLEDDSSSFQHCLALELKNLILSETANEANNNDDDDESF